MHSRNMLRNAKGDHLEHVHSDQMVLEIIRWGRLVLFIGGQGRSSKKTVRLESTQIRWFS
jgi:hypothetical protein